MACDPPAQNIPTYLFKHEFNAVFVSRAVLAILPTTEVVKVSHGDNPGDDVSHHGNVAGQGSVGPDVPDLRVLTDICTTPSGMLIYHTHF